MSEPTLKELMENPIGWSDYSTESIVYMAKERIEELEAENKRILRDWNIERTALVKQLTHLKGD